MQRRDDGALLVLAPLLPGEEVHHLEFVPVGVVAIEALRRPVIGFADERIRAQEILAGLGQVLDRGDLPSEVVQTGRPARRARRIGADREQAQIVMVVRACGAQKGHHAALAGNDLEAEKVAVERARAIEVADVQDGVVEALDADHGTGFPPSGATFGRVYPGYTPAA